MSPYIWILLLSVMIFGEVESNQALRQLTSQFNRLRRSVARDIDDLRWELETEKARTSNLEALLNATAESSAGGFEIADTATDTADKRIKGSDLEKRIEDLEQENGNLKTVVENQKSNLSKALFAIKRLEESTAVLKGTKGETFTELKGLLGNEIRKLENELGESHKKNTAVFTRAFEGEKKRLREFKEDVKCKAVNEEQVYLKSEMKQIINNSIETTVQDIRKTCEHAVGQLEDKVEDAITNTNIVLEAVSDTQEMHTKQLQNLTTYCNSKQELSRPPQRKTAFTARMDTHRTNMRPQQTIVFDNVVTNINSCYSSGTGIFTANTKGTFFFFASIMTHGGARLETEIVKNGNDVAYMYNYVPGDHDQGMNGAVLDLEKGDRVWVRIHQRWGDRVYGWGWSSFSGFQIL